MRKFIFSVALSLLIEFTSTLKTFYGVERKVKTSVGPEVCVRNLCELEM